MHVNFVPFLTPLVVLASLASPGAVSPSFNAGFLLVADQTHPKTFTIVANMMCANYLGYTPKYLDYYIEDTANNNGHEYPTLIARRTYNYYARTAPAGDTVILVGAVAQSINITGY
ncbi:hypothetical protein B0H17DRAFT_1063179 [Mycena rosella]|uniref:Uncharacterized protein n=1 Tax=Mycena rosella TaxID=1033263 RepID=A0AAD7DH64_MYCRO|nr:hypothetical protein B0H17DRAFT_1063179 [Mycena rosella]